MYTGGMHSSVTIVAKRSKEAFKKYFKHSINSQSDSESQESAWAMLFAQKNEGPFHAMSGQTKQDWVGEGEGGRGMYGRINF